MPRLDKIHHAIKNALVNDGWTITHDPYPIEYEGERLYADLGAERPFAAEREGRKIVVEIKSFIGLSPIRDFQAALGQFGLYRVYLAMTAPERKLYLAISEGVYNRLFTRKSFGVVIEQLNVSLLVVNLQAEEVVQWIN